MPDAETVTVTIDTRGPVYRSQREPATRPVYVTTEDGEIVYDSAGTPRVKRGHDGEPLSEPAERDVAQEAEDNEMAWRRRVAATLRRAAYKIEHFGAYAAGPVGVNGTEGGEAKINID